MVTIKGFDRFLKKKNSLVSTQIFYFFLIPYISYILLEYGQGSQQIRAKFKTSFFHSIKNIK